MTTTQDWRTMATGPQLDALVAEAVGWQVWLERRGEYTYVVWQQAGEREPYRQSCDWETAMARYQRITAAEIDYHRHIYNGSLPHYSTDPAAAFTVLSYVRDRWIYHKRRKFTRMLQQVVSGRAFPRLDRLIAPEEVVIYMQPVDICRAILAAKEVA